MMRIWEVSYNVECDSTSRLKCRNNFDDPYSLLKRQRTKIISQKKCPIVLCIHNVRYKVLVASVVLSPTVQAACDHMKSWFGATPEGDWVSMGVFSDGSYGTPEGVMFSFPVTTNAGTWAIVQVSHSVCTFSCLVQ